MPKRGSAFVFMDARKVTQPLRVRPRRPGDRMRPLGLSGKSREIKKILADMKVPLAQRQDWPMVVMGAEIVWVHLGPVSETVKLDAHSQRAIRVCLNPAGRVCKPQARTRRRVPSRLILKDEA
jgi:tRNA(Ile)-lysidine synthase